MEVIIVCICFVILCASATIYGRGKETVSVMFHTISITSRLRRYNNKEGKCFWSETCSYDSTDFVFDLLEAVV